MDTLGAMVVPMAATACLSQCGGEIDLDQPSGAPDNFLSADQNIRT